MLDELFNDFIHCLLLSSQLHLLDYAHPVPHHSSSSSTSYYSRRTGYWTHFDCVAKLGCSEEFELGRNYSWHVGDFTELAAKERRGVLKMVDWRKSLSWA